MDLPSTAATQQHFVQAVKLKDLQARQNQVVQLEGHTIALFIVEQTIYAIDNRCPHMGFPLQGGPCKDGLITCPWHYARFDLASGGTFDAWADDVQAYPVEIRGEDIWVDLAPKANPLKHQQQRLQDGLEQSISLVIAKSAIALLDLEQRPEDIFQMGLTFGSRYNKYGWGTGLSIHTCLMRLLPYLDREDRPRALYQGLSAVARDSAGAPPRFIQQPLPQPSSNPTQLHNWFRQFIERRDHEAAERCLVTAVQTNMAPQHIANMLFAAATDHRYLDGGHTLDFINKALEALDLVNWQDADLVLSSLIPNLAHAMRREESNAWRYPIDLVEILDRAFEQLPEAIAHGRPHQGTWAKQTDIIPVLLGDDPEAIAQTLLTALQEGCTEENLAGIVTYAAAMRVVQFNLNNDHRDWNSAHHPFTFANAVHQGLRRVPSTHLVRGVFDAAMSVYLNRFLNVPPARLPQVQESHPHPEDLLQDLSALLDQQQQITSMGRCVAHYLYSGGDPQRLMAQLGKLMLRENRDFHVIQEMEAAFSQYAWIGPTPEGFNLLIAAARYLAAHSPTMRSQNQTFDIASKLHQGQRLFEAES